MTSYVKTVHDTENRFFQNVFLIMLNNFCHDKRPFKIKLKCQKRTEVYKFLKNGKMTPLVKCQKSQQITEKCQNDDYKLRHTSKTGHDMKKIFFAK